MKMKMMKTMKMKAAGLFLAVLLGATVFTGCGSSGNATDQKGFDYDNEITVISREDGSGTRGAFVELSGVEQKNEAGEKIDYTTLEATITNNTSVMMTSVANDVYAIGYISLGSMNDTVKAIAIDDVEISAEAVKNGSYQMSRPFHLATAGEVSEAAEDFLNYILSAEGQAVIEGEGYVAIDDSAEEFASNGAAGKVVIAGSSSVTPVMEKLKEAYGTVNANVTIEIHTSDSSTGVASVTEGTCDFGMVSRELKDSEKEAGVQEITIARDGIAVIVNNENPVDGLPMETVKDIYVGDILTWSEI